MSDDLEFIVIDDIPEYIFCIGDDEENEQVIALSGKDGAFKYEKVDELPTTGEDGVLYLVPKSHTTQTASGNPINVNITDNAGKIESLKLDGDTEQTTYTGKNLLGFPNGSFTSNGVTSVWENGKVTMSGTATSNQVFVTSYLPNTLQAGTYTFSMGGTEAPHRFIFRTFNDNDETIASYILEQGATSVEVTIAGTEAKYRIVMLASRGTTYDETDYFQLEAGSTPTSGWEPYTGGQASPSPSYPQDINVVTGTQTVSINGTDYSIDLGSIELCKLGDYQDYIYKDGDDWKVHKATNEATLNGSEAWHNAGGNAPFGLVIDGALITTSDDNPPLAYCDKFYRVSQNASWSAYESLISTSGINYSTKTVRIRYTDIASLEDFKTWLGNNNTILYYVLATATDTVITDTALIAQLEAVRTAALSTGSNTISNTATGTNLAGDLEIGYYGYDPLNKYDKYFWLDVDGEYESL